MKLPVPPVVLLTLYRASIQLRQLLARCRRVKVRRSTKAAVLAVLCGLAAASLLVMYFAPEASPLPDHKNGLAGGDPSQYSTEVQTAGGDSNWDNEFVDMVNLPEVDDHLAHQTVAHLANGPYTRISIPTGKSSSATIRPASGSGTADQTRRRNSAPVVKSAVVSKTQASASNRTSTSNATPAQLRGPMNPEAAISRRDTSVPKTISPARASAPTVRAAKAPPARPQSVAPDVAVTPSTTEFAPTTNPTVSPAIAATGNIQQSAIPAHQQPAPVAQRFAQVQPRAERAASPAAPWPATRTSAARKPVASKPLTAPSNAFEFEQHERARLPNTRGMTPLQLEAQAAEIDAAMRALTAAPPVAESQTPQPVNTLPVQNQPSSNSVAAPPGASVTPAVTPTPVAAHPAASPAPSVPSVMITRSTAAPVEAAPATAIPVAPIAATTATPVSLPLASSNSTERQALVIRSIESQPPKPAPTATTRMPLQADPAQQPRPITAQIAAPITGPVDQPRHETVAQAPRTQPLYVASNRPLPQQTLPQQTLPKQVSPQHAIQNRPIPRQVLPDRYIAQGTRAPGAPAPAPRMPETPPLQEHNVDPIKPLAQLGTNIAPPGEGELPANRAAGFFDNQGVILAAQSPNRDWIEYTYYWQATAFCHQPLYFEEINLERYGHTACPLLQPVLSGAHFFGTVAILPYKMGLDHPSECIYTLGEYRPGDNVPWQRCPMRVTPDAIFAEGAVITGLILLIP
ncbi:MAG: hypothetical protein SGJ20_00955 [Planctomycetota bacterium]|nr:hypothetical protein [Planctomycetota bacterium]